MRKKSIYTTVATITVTALAANVANLARAQEPAPVRAPDNIVVAGHLARAKDLSNVQFDYLFNRRCPAPRPRPSAGEEGEGGRTRATRSTPEPAQAFDNLYWVGKPTNSMWAVKGNDNHLLLIDSLDGPEDADTVIIPGLQKLGLDPKKIDALLITHAHGDHYGAANRLKQLLGIPIYATDLDWAAMESFKAGKWGGPEGWQGLVPPRDKVLHPQGASSEVMPQADGVVTVYDTRGHTAGSVSMIIKTSWKGEPHTVAFWGGQGYPGIQQSPDPTPGATERAWRDYDASITRFMAIAKAAGADVLMTNHTYADNTLEYNAAMKANPTGANPWIIGVDGVQRWLGVMRECGEAQAARLGW